MLSPLDLAVVVISSNLSFEGGKGGKLASLAAQTKILSKSLFKCDWPGESHVAITESIILV